MRFIANVILTVVSALWLGGIVALLMLVQHLFKHDRAIAVQAAPVMFVLFEKYQIGLAAIAIGTLLLARQRHWRFTLIPISLAAALAVASAAMLTPRIEHLRQAGQSGTPAFRSLHGASMALYSIEVALLLTMIVTQAWCVRNGAGSRNQTLTGEIA